MRRLCLVGAVASGLVGFCFLAGCITLGRPDLSSASELRVTKYTLAPGGNKVETRLLARPEVVKVVRLLGDRRVNYASLSMTEYSLDFRSADGQSLGVVDVLGRGVEWHLEGQGDYSCAVTPGLMNYLDGLFAPIGDVK